MMWLQHEGLPASLPPPGTMPLGSVEHPPSPHRRLLSPLQLNATGTGPWAGAEHDVNAGERPSIDRARAALPQPLRPRSTPRAARREKTPRPMEQVPPLPRMDNPLAFIADGVHLKGNDDRSIVDDHHGTYRCNSSRVSRLQRHAVCVSGVCGASPLLTGWSRGPQSFSLLFTEPPASSPNLSVGEQDSPLAGRWVGGWVGGGLANGRRCL